MALYDVFNNAAETVFKVFKSLILQGTYLESNATGWEERGAEPDPTPHLLDVIPSQMSKEDVERLSFSELVQPTDVVIMVRGRELTVPMKTSNFFKVAHKTGEKTYSVEAWDTDPAEALYMILLRTAK